MGNLCKIGRIFYGISIVEFGIQAIYCREFPYILQLPEHLWKPAGITLALIFGLISVFAGVCMLFYKKARQISLLYGGILLLIFCFYYIPYELSADPNYMHFPSWENAEKELALAAGALVVAACFANGNENKPGRFLSKLIQLGAILFSITMISFGVLHFLLAKESSPLVPAWIPYHMFWMYFCGAALIGAGAGIIFRAKTGLIAFLLGTMIFIWFIILHIPRIIAAPAADIKDEITSAFLALAYCGIAFVISGGGYKRT